MTGVYEWNPMPHRVAVRCPACASEATFEFAEVVRIRRKADIAYFQKSRLFEYAFFEGRWHGQSFHGAIFHAGLHGGTTAILRDLPEGYAPEDWNHSRTLVRSRPGDRGTIVCKCGIRRKHALDWPGEAWFSVEYRRQGLWAFDRESATDLRDYVASTDREPKRFRWASFLLHVPSVFLAASARPTIVTRLSAALAR